VDADTDGAFRMWYGRTWPVPLPGPADDMEIAIEGTQTTDGTVDHEIRVSGLHHDDVLDSRTARLIASALNEAADELDQWSAR
jgi:hypothetical protein